MRYVKQGEPFLDEVIHVSKPESHEHENWQIREGYCAACGKRVPRRWPVGSKEPKELNLKVRSDLNNVVFRRGFSGQWWALPQSGGDGQWYTWNHLNADHAWYDGMDLVEVMD